MITDSAQAAAAMTSNPPQGWRDGFGKVGPEGELAAVLHYAEKGFPAGGKSLTIQVPHRTSSVYEALMARARDMERAGVLTIQSDGMGLEYIGDLNHVREAMRRKPGLMADEEQHPDILPRLKPACYASVRLRRRGVPKLPVLRGHCSLRDISVPFAAILF